MASKISSRDTTWHLKNSWWIIFSFVACSWISFIYIGRKAKKPYWVYFGFVFLVLQLGGLLSFGYVSGAAVEAVGIIWLAAWVAGIILAFKWRKEFLVRLDILQETGTKEKEDQAMRRAAEIELGAKGAGAGAGVAKASRSKASRTKTPASADAPANANDLRSAILQSQGVAVDSQQNGPGQGTQANAASAEKPEAIDINSCTESELASLPGITAAMAKRAVAHRNDNAGFSSVDDFYEAIQLKPHQIAKIDGRISCNIPSPAEPEGGNQPGTRTRKLDF